MHFDTGSEATLLSNQRWAAPGRIVAPLNSLEWFTRAVRVGLGDARPITYFHFRDDGALTPSRHGSIRISLRALAVRNWRHTKLALVCPDGHCAGSVALDGGAEAFYCGSREGLIGRDFILANSLRLVLDAKTYRTYVLDGEDPEDSSERIDRPSEGPSGRRMWGLRSG